jgi:hypothetical protein
MMRRRVKTAFWFPRGTDGVAYLRVAPPGKIAN